jgi:hypothetical protein
MKKPQSNEVDAVRGDTGCDTTNFHQPGAIAMLI